MRNFLSFKINSKIQDAILFYFLRLVSVIVIGILIFIILILIKAALPSIMQNGLMFIAHKEWNPVDSHFGALTFIFGTLLTSFLALFIAAPVSIL